MRSEGGGEESTGWDQGQSSEWDRGQSGAVYEDELAGIHRRQRGAVLARMQIFQALAAAGLPSVHADRLVSVLEGGAVAGAHSLVAESSPPHDADTSYQDGWFAGVRAVTCELWRIADHTATQRGRATSSLEEATKLESSPGSHDSPGTAPPPPPGLKLE